MCLRALNDIDKIGQLLVSCSRNCEGIRNEPENGVVPRGFYFENPENLKEPDCIIVGVNPGISKKREREYYIRAFYEKRKITYNDVKQYFNDKVSKLRYYKRLREFAREIGFGRAILWTELCKCENKIKKEVPPLQTFRICVKNFLQRELKLFPKAPIIGIGNQTFQALSYMFPDRFIVGVPHPTGSYGNFAQLFDEKGKLKEKYRKIAKIVEDRHGDPNCVKIFPVIKEIQKSIK
jgi:DNA polymerase